MFQHPFIIVSLHRRSWVIFRGGPTIPYCQNSILSCQHFFLSGGAKFADSVLCQVTVLSYFTKLICPQANMAGEWLKNKQKWKKNRKLWKKPTKRDRKKNKNDRKTGKMRSFTNYIICIICQAQIYVLTSSNFCPAKLPFLSCQAPISVLPRSHLFVLPSEAIFSRGGQGPPSPPLSATPMGAYGCLPVPTSASSVFKAPTSAFILFIERQL